MAIFLQATVPARENRGSDPVTRLHAVPLPMDVDPEMLEIVRELSRVTCMRRAFVEVTLEEIVVHFEAMDDAVVFMDNLAFLLTSIGEDIGVIKDGEMVPVETNN